MVPESLRTTGQEYICLQSLRIDCSYTVRSLFLRLWTSVAQRRVNTDKITQR